MTAGPRYLVHGVTTHCFEIVDDGVGTTSRIGWPGMVTDHLATVATHSAYDEVGATDIDAEYVFQRCLAQSVRMACNALVTCSTSMSTMHRWWPSGQRIGPCSEHGRHANPCNSTIRSRGPVGP
jgi:hypothetical protein